MTTRSKKRQLEIANSKCSGYKQMMKHQHDNCGRLSENVKKGNVANSLKQRLWDNFDRCKTSTPFRLEDNKFINSTDSDTNTSTPELSRQKHVHSFQLSPVPAQSSPPMEIIDSPALSGYMELRSESPQSHGLFDDDGYDSVSLDHQRDHQMVNSVRRASSSMKDKSKTVPELCSTESGIVCSVVGTSKDSNDCSDLPGQSYSDSGLYKKVSRELQSQSKQADRERKEMGVITRSKLPATKEQGKHLKKSPLACSDCEILDYVQGCSDVEQHSLAAYKKKSRIARKRHSDSDDVEPSDSDDAVHMSSDGIKNPPEQLPVVASTSRYQKHGQVETKLTVNEVDEQKMSESKQSKKKRRTLYNGSVLNEDNMCHEEANNASCNRERRSAEKDTKICSVGQLPSNKQGAKAEPVEESAIVGATKTRSHRKHLAVKSIRGKSLSIHEVSISPQRWPAVELRNLPENVVETGLTSKTAAGQDWEELRLDDYSFDDRVGDQSLKLYKSVKKLKENKCKPHLEKHTLSRKKQCGVIGTDISPVNKQAKGKVRKRAEKKNCDTMEDEDEDKLGDSEYTTKDAYLALVSQPIDVHKDEVKKRQPQRRRQNQEQLHASNDISLNSYKQQMEEIEDIANNYELYVE